MNEPIDFPALVLLVEKLDSNFKRMEDKISAMEENLGRVREIMDRTYEKMERLSEVETNVAMMRQKAEIEDRRKDKMDKWLQMALVLMASFIGGVISQILRSQGWM